MNYSWTWTVTQRPSPSTGGEGSGGSGGGSSSNGGSSGGSSGGGGGVSSPEPFHNIEKSLRKDSNLAANKSVPYILPGFTIYEVDVIGSSSDYDVTLKVEHLKNISFTADKYPAGKIYANENIWISSKRINFIVIKFKVPNSWLKNNSLNEEDVKLLKYDGNWWKLNTNITGTDASYTYYRALSQTPSAYAISGLKDAPNTIDNPYLLTSQTDDSKNKTSKNTTLQNTSIPNDLTDNKKLQVIGLITVAMFLLMALVGYVVGKNIIRKLMKKTTKKADDENENK